MRICECEPRADGEIHRSHEISDAKRLQVEGRFLKAGLRFSNPQFLGFSNHCLRKLPSNPLDFPADILDDVARLEMFGEHIPCVGLDLQLS